jgi:eukaryotic-like serine/threonine-protein kinase
MTERELFEAALDVPPEDRAAYLDRVCGADGALRLRLEGLLRKHDEARSFLEAPPPEVARTVIGPAVEEVGTQVGPYTLLEQIGEGGFGIVFMAEQQAPVRRRVALKIIKPGMDTRQVLARFEAERQALALMDHPNIARALDAGATESGRPYFVMELVRGVPITDYCDQNKLAVHERLELFVEVCRAVQHAHQKGIIHRDIKPSNVLVTMHDGRPVPKMIDFGVAKAINQQLTPETVFTRFSEMIGTPLYMSPEQAEMTSLDIDTRSDIYSLGVLLYELLTGTTPFDNNRLKQAAFDEIRRIIREEEPPKPSLRISTLGEKRTVVAAHRHADPNRLSQLLRGDLDWIVMKAMEKDRTRRYETANGLGTDVERHLADEPVLASPPSAVYRLTKFARRNRVAFTTSIAVLAAIVAGTGLAVTEAIRATRAERLADSRLQAETAARAEAERAGRAEAKQRAIAESRQGEAEAMRKRSDASARQARRAVDEFFTLVSESQLLDVPGLQPLRKRLLESALRYYENFQKQHGGDSSLRSELAATHLRIAQVYEQNNRIDDSFHELSRSLDLIEGLLREKPLPAGFPQCLAGIRKRGRVLTYFTLWPTDGPEAVRVSARAVALWERLARDYPNTIGFQGDLASLYGVLSDMRDNVDDVPGALHAAESSVRLFERLSAQHPREPEYRTGLADALEYVARTLRKLDRAQEAWTAAQRALAIRVKLVGEFPGTPEYRAACAYSHCRIASFLNERGRLDEAIAAYQSSIERFRKLVAEFPTDPGFRKRLSHALLRCAVSQMNRGTLADAERNARQALEMSAKLAAEDPGEQGDNLAEACESQQLLAEVLERSNRRTEARAQFLEAVDSDRKLASRFPENVDKTRGHRYRDFAFAAGGHVEEAELGFRAAIDFFQRLTAREPRKLEGWHLLADTHRLLAQVLVTARRPNEAEQEFRRAVEIHESALERSHVDPFDEEEWAASYLDLARFLQSKGRSGAADEIVRRLISRTEASVSAFPGKPASRERLARVHYEVANSLRDLKRVDDSESHYRQALALFEKLAGEFPSNDGYRLEVGHTLWRLADVAADSGRPQEAEKQHRRALAIYKSLAVDFPQNRDYRWEQCFSDWSIAGLMRQLGRLKDAEKAYRDAIDVCQKVLAKAADDAEFRDRLARSHFELAEVLRGENRLDDAEKHYRQAEATWRQLGADVPAEPRHRIDAIWTSTYELGPLLAKNGRTREAEKVYRTAIDLLTALPVTELVADDRRGMADTCYANLIRLLQDNHRLQDATAVMGARLDLRRKIFAKIVEQNPKSAAAYYNLGDALARFGRWDEALAAIDKAAELEPANHWYVYHAAPLYLRAGDVAGYRRACRAMLERFQNTQTPEVADRTAKTCLLLPDAVPDFDRVQKLADRAVSGTEKHPYYHWFVFAKGLAEYRAGRFAEAVKWLNRFGPNADGGHSDASAFAVLAMAQDRLGQKQPAHAALHSAQTIFAAKRPDPGAGRPFDSGWYEWLHCEVFLREAEGLLKPERTHASQTPQKEGKAAK